MGKRKRVFDQNQADHPPHLSGMVPFSNQMDLLSDEGQGLARPLFMKRSRHQYSHQYSRRGPTCQANASTSRENQVGTIDERSSVKFAGHCNLEFQDRIESMDRAPWGLERIRYSSTKDGISSHGMKMLCGICQKLMRRKLCFLGNTFTSSELPVAAVLVCGHVYHADCLENRLNHEDRSDPPCPMCAELPSKLDDKKKQE